jgi:hypothetical protein
MKRMQTETLSIRISKAEITALRKRARQERVSQGSYVRRALRAYGSKPAQAAESKPAKSGYDVVKHLIGRCKGGPKDLSTNPRYFEGFGE